VRVRARDVRHRDAGRMGLGRPGRTRRVVRRRRGGGGMTARRRLIVNADDFGLTDGVTGGIARAHRDGIVTSTSLMVDAPGARAAARLARELPGLDIAPDSLLRMIDAEVGAGWTELACHPGETSPDLASSYAAEREIELATLCDPADRHGLAERGVELAGFSVLAAEG